MASNINSSKLKTQLQMRKLYTLLALVAIGFLSNAQTALKESRLAQRLYLDPAPMVSPQNNAHGNHHSNGSHSQLKSLRSTLNSQKIGRAGNLLTVIEPGCNQIDANDSLNAVTFVHRVDNTVIVSANIAQYCYDISKDGGNTWDANVGPITNDPAIDNISVAGRFPQGVIYNKPGNTNVDSAYLVYAGTWHNSPPTGNPTGSWQGQMRGRGKLSGDTATYNVHIDSINHGHVNIASGMCQGPAGTFWNINQDYTGTFTTTDDEITQGLIIEKGVWNSITGDVDWTSQTIPQTFAKQDISNNNTVAGSVATAFNIAFDPTGRYGWAACLGNIRSNPGLDSVYDPIFWKTTDFGAHWTGPIWVDLDSLPGVIGKLGTTLSDYVGGGPSTGNPTTSYECDLTVDVNGNPHLLTTVGSGKGFAIEFAGYNVYDITYTSNGISGCNWNGWSAIDLAKIYTLRGTFSNDNPALTEDNRPQVSRSPDAHKIFFFWNESDRTFELSDNNDVPNLFGRAIDVVTGKKTPMYNFTEGDSLWGGQTSNSPAGVFDGAIFPVVGQTCLLNGNNYNIPLVLTQIDYLHDPSGPGSDAQPCQFYYINNINIPASDFNATYGVPPVVTLEGPDTILQLINTSYFEYGAIATDCHDGDIAVSIQNAPDTAHAGTYNELYIATDSAGNSDTVVRVVIIGSPPVADFTWITGIYAYQVSFHDISTNSPISWHWDYGNGTGSLAPNPVKTFGSVDSVYNVCLTATNEFGTSSPTCHAVTVNGVHTLGIAEVGFAQHVSLFPNPTNGKVSISFDENTSSDFTVSAYNVLGELVTAPAEYKAGTTNVKMDLASLSNGIYIIKIQSSEGTAIKNLVLTHK